MFKFPLSILLSIATSAHAVNLCRLVCPPNVSPLTTESLGPDGSSQCLWTGGGFGFRFASYDAVRNISYFFSVL